MRDRETQTTRKRQWADASEVKNPLILLEEDQITEEIVNVEEVQVVIVEGT